MEMLLKIKLEISKLEIGIKVESSVAKEGK